MLPAVQLPLCYSFMDEGDLTMRTNMLEFVFVM